MELNLGRCLPTPQLSLKRSHTSLRRVVSLLPTLSLSGASSLIAS